MGSLDKTTTTAERLDTTARECDTTYSNPLLQRLPQASCGVDSVCDGVNDKTSKPHQYGQNNSTQIVLKPTDWSGTVLHSIILVPSSSFGSCDVTDSVRTSFPNSCCVVDRTGQYTAKLRQVGRFCSERCSIGVLWRLPWTSTYSYGTRSTVYTLPLLNMVSIEV